MSRLAVLLPVLAGLVVGCKRTPAGPTTVATDSFTDGAAMVEVELGFSPAGPREIDLVVDLRAVGVEQMDRVVVQLEVGDFHLVDGDARWSGFVPPRDPQRHTVRLVAVDGQDAPRLPVSISRSRDSHVLFSTVLDLRVVDDVVRAP
jgi:hypothetical protein